MISLSHGKKPRKLFAYIGLHGDRPKLIYLPLPAHSSENVYLLEIHWGNPGTTLSGLMECPLGVSHRIPYSIVVVHAFRKCPILNTVVGLEDDLLWEGAKNKEGSSENNLE